MPNHFVETRVRVLARRKSKMQVTFLGTGTSYGVPHIGCDCAVCASDDARNKRLRASILVEHDGTRILIDTTPDLRTQLLRARVRKLDAVLWTHWHNDHVIGLDDLRPISDAQGYIPGFCSAQTLGNLKQTFSYVFVEGREHRGYPRVRVTAVEAGTELRIGTLRVTPLNIAHGKNTILAYRFEPRVLAQGENQDLQNESAPQTNARHKNTASEDATHASDENEVARRERMKGENARNTPESRHFTDGRASTRGPVVIYATDCSGIPDTSRQLMQDADLLILGALRHREHFAHFTVAQAVEESRKLRARSTLFTHIAHDLDHEETCAQFPNGIKLAHDELHVGLTCVD